MKTVTIHTDGGCENNPGPGGWAAVLECAGRTRELSGGAPATTNNRMELTAAIEALAVLKAPCEVILWTDSRYLCDNVVRSLPQWKRRGWRTVAKQPVKNVELWRRLDDLFQRHRIQWKWLKGHSGHALNERCDILAAAEIARIKQAISPARLREFLLEFKAGQILPAATQAVDEMLLPLK